MKKIMIIEILLSFCFIQFLFFNPVFSQPIERLTASDFEHEVVVSRPDQMYAWPGITRVKEQEILVGATERKYHVDPSGREIVVRSYNGGKTWELPQEIYDSELDDRDTNLLTTPDGTIIATWFTSDAFCLPRYFREEWRERAERVTQRMRDELNGGWLLRSFDGGHTWGPTAHRTPVGQHAGPSVCANGRLVYIGPKKDPDGSARMLSFESMDGGMTWKKMGEIACERSGNPLSPVLNENHILEISPEHLLVMFRCEKNAYLYQSDSYDGGKTWTPAKQLAIWGLPPYLTKLHSGAILCSYGHRRAPYSIRAVLSYDDGKTWDTENIITIYEWDHPLDMGYPVTLELTPGQLITVYYCNRKHEIFLNPSLQTERQDLPQGILYTRWKLK